MICIVEGVSWYMDPATGRHWKAPDPDTEMSETEIEVAPSGAPEIVGTDGAETGILETENHVLAAAQALITAVR